MSECNCEKCRAALSVGSPLNGWPQIGLLSAIAVLGSLVVMLLFWPVIATTHSGHGSRSCSSNIKQAALGFLMYAQDFDETMPPAPHWIDGLQPYIKNESVFTCPDLPKEGKGQYGYAYSYKVSRLAMKEIPQPSATPMVYDTDLLYRSAVDFVGVQPRPGRHFGKNNVAFVDGHAKAVPDTTRLNPLPRTHLSADAPQLPH